MLAQPSRHGKQNRAARLFLLLVALLSLWLLAACGGADNESGAANGGQATATVEVAETPAEPTAETAPEETIEQEPSATDTPTEAPTEAPTATELPPTATPLPAPTSTPAPTAVPARINGLPTILEIDLPPEAWDTLDLIDSDGPFPFDRDGITFQNREGLLPNEPRGYYREYTVITPGERTRGARRIVTGEDGEFYYTDDHYESFHYIVRPER